MNTLPTLSFLMISLVCSLCAIATPLHASLMAGGDEGVFAVGLGAAVSGSANDSWPASPQPDEQEDLRVLLDTPGGSLSLSGQMVGGQTTPCIRSPMGPWWVSRSATGRLYLAESLHWPQPPIRSLLKVPIL